MSNIQDNQRGFSTVEALLILVIVGLIGFVGWYVWHSKQVADKTISASNKSASSQTVTSKQSLAKPKLEDAVAQTQADYALYTSEVLKGQVLQDQSQWSKNNVMAAEDLQFMNNHKNLFQGSFITLAEAVKSNGTKANENGFLECLDVYSNNDFSVLGVNLSGNKASVTVSYTSTASKTLHKPWPVTLAYQGGSWLISGVDLSTQYCS